MLLSPSLLSGFGCKGAFGSNGIATGFVHSMPSCFKMDLIYAFCLIEIELGDHVISIPMILKGSLRSVVSHSVHISFFIFFIRRSDVVNNNRLSTHTVIITNLSCSFQICHRRARGCPGGRSGPTSCGRRCTGEGEIVGAHLGRWINCLHLGPLR